MHAQVRVLPPQPYSTSSLLLEINVAELKIFTGNAHRALANRVVDRLRMDLGNAEVGRFSNGEVSVEIEDNVRGKDVFIIQPTCAPTNDNLMELIVLADCLRRASATRITAVIPYFGYARQDRRVRSARVPITAKVVADMVLSFLNISAPPRPD